MGSSSKLVLILKAMFSSVRGIALASPWLLYLLLVDMLLSAILPISAVWPNGAQTAASALAYTVWSWIQLIFEGCNGGVIGFSGTTLPRGESAIVIANHVSWTDFYMIQALALRAGMLGRCRWFAKIQLRSVPFLGWGLWAMGMPLVSRDWTKDKKEINKVFAGVTERKWPIWLISYSEGTRYTPKKYEETKVWCKANSKPVPKHLLYPRTKGFVSCVQHLRKAKHVTAVYDITIAYSHNNNFQEAPTMWQSLSLSNLTKKRAFKFHVHTERFELRSLPETDAELAKWLEQRWMAKGDWLEEKKNEWARS